MRDKGYGSWSKWGGYSEQLRKKKIDVEWNCQTCGESQPNELKPFLMKWDETTVVRICAKCLRLAEENNLVFARNLKYLKNQKSKQ